MKRILLLLVVAYAFQSPAPAQTTLNLSQDLVSLGIASTNMLPNRPDIDAGPLFFQAVSGYARNHQISRVIADPGAYYFSSLQYQVSTPTQYAAAHVAWDKLSNLTIDLQGSDLYFSHPLAGGMSITNSTNLVLENFTADYDPLPFTQVRVVSVNPAQQSIQFAVDGNWQNPSVFNQVFALPSNPFQGVEVHFFRNGRPIAGVPRMHAADPVGSTQFTATPDPGFTTSAVIARIRPGDIAFLGMRYTNQGISTLFCTACVFRNIVVYSGGFEAGFAESSVFEHVYSIPRPGTDRLVSSYTGLFFPGPGPNNNVRLNRMIRTMDNPLEYDGEMIGTVQSQADSHTFVVTGSITSRVMHNEPVPNGSAVVFQRLSDGAFMASAVTTSPVAPPYSGNQATFTFDRDLPAGIVGTVMFGSDPNLRAGNSVIERNAVQETTDCCNGFFVAGVANSVFRGNYVHRSAMAGLQTDNSIRPGNFNSPPATNFAISNNVIDGANFTLTGYPDSQLGGIQIYATNAPNLLTTSPHQNISVSSNFITDSGSAAVWLGNTTNGSVTGNYFLNSNINAAVESAVSSFGPIGQPLLVESSQNAATSNNTVDQTSGRIWVTYGQYRELAAYAPGSVVRLNAYGIGTLSPAPTITLTDADGNTAPLTIQIASAHAIDAQIPAAAGLGGAYVTLTSGGVKYFGTLFLDAVDNIPALNGCTYEVSPSSTSVGGGYTSLPILVVTQPGCSYQVLATDSFVNGGPTAGGPGVITVGFTANSGAARTTTIEVAGQPLSLTQEAHSGPLASRFVPITPCRVADTRNASGPLGGPAITGGMSRSFVVPSSACGIPSNAAAYSMNVAVVPHGTLGFLTLWPSGQAQPLVATLNSLDGRVKSNAAIVPAGSNGAISVFATDTTDVVLDINGYFVDPSNSAALAFYPLTPCRIADTRNANGPLGGPSLPARSTRAFPILASACGLPANAQAYSLNFAAVPKGPLGYLTAWPAGQPQPLAASLNDVTGTIAANAVIVPAGTNGAVNVFASDATDLVIDVSGYFAPPGPGGLSLYGVTPCRVLDTRLTSGTPFSTTQDVNVVAAPCGVPGTARAFLFNVTAIPANLLGYLTMWPQGQPQPLAATLNAFDGAITNNMAIVPTTNGSVSIFPTGPTHLVLDAFGFFAP
jgi:hypothetical protein